MAKNFTPEQTKLLDMLWCEYWASNARVLQIRSEGTTEAMLPRVFAEDRRGAAAMRRIRELYGERY